MCGFALWPKRDYLHRHGLIQGTLDDGIYTPLNVTDGVRVRKLHFFQLSPFIETVHEEPKVPMKSLITALGKIKLIVLRNKFAKSVCFITACQIA